MSLNISWFSVSHNNNWIQGEAKSAELLGDAIKNNPAFITLRKIEASRDIANTVSSSQNRVFLPNDSLLLNVQQLGVDQDLGHSSTTAANKNDSSNAMRAD